MRTSRVVGLLLLATATLAQQQQPVEITSEPSHHLVFENEYVRVFDVTVAPKATTLVHRHGHDYLIVTLGDSDVINARVGEKPVPLHLNDGEVRYTAGNFAHASANESERPFHNITIELFKPSSNVKQYPHSEGDPVTTHAESVVMSDKWTAWLYLLPSGLLPSGDRGKHRANAPQLFVAVSTLEFGLNGSHETKTAKRVPGDIAWIPAGADYTAVPHGQGPAQFVALEFKPREPKQ